MRKSFMKYSFLNTQRSAFLVLGVVVALLYQNCSNVQIAGFNVLVQESLEHQISGKICYPYSALDSSAYDLKALYVINLTALQTQDRLRSDSNLNGITDQDEDQMSQSQEPSSATKTVLVSPMDSDEDGLPDFIEILKGLNPNSADLDRDGMDYDGLLNRQEIQRGTDPFFADANEKFVHTSVKKREGEQPQEMDCGRLQPVYDFEIQSVPLVKTRAFTDTRNSMLYDLSHTEYENIILVLAELSPTDSSRGSYFTAKFLKVPITHDIKHTLNPKDFGPLIDSQDDCPTCTPIGTTYRYKKVMTKAFHTCALSTSSELFCWGSNSSGQLGDGSTQERLQPVKVPGLSGVVDFSLGDQHTCAVTDVGQVFCWGANSFGQLGLDQDVNFFSSPQLVSLLEGPAHRLSTSARHTCASLASGAVFCWGDNAKKALGAANVSGDLSLRPVAVNFSEEPVYPLRAMTSFGDFNCLIDGRATSSGGGRLFCWGTSGYSCLIAQGTPAPFHFDNSDVSACGNSFPRQATRLEHLLEHLKDVQFNFNAFVVHREDSKSLIAWTHEDYFRTDLSSNWTGEVPEDPGGMRELLGPVEKVRISHGSQFFFIRYELQDPDSDPVTGVHELRLRLLFEPTSYASVSEPLDVSSVGTHSCAINIQGVVYCWGDNTFGQLGTQDKEAYPSPVPVKAQ